MKEGGRKGRDERKRGEIKEGVGRWIKKRGRGRGRDNDYTDTSKKLYVCSCPILSVATDVSALPPILCEWYLVKSTHFNPQRARER